MTASRSTGERLIKMMDGPYIVNGKPRRIDSAFIQPPQGNTIYTVDRRQALGPRGDSTTTWPTPSS